MLDVDTAVVPQFDLTAQGLHVTGDARFAWASGELGGALTADLTSMPDFVRPWLAEDADAFTGTGRSATIGGTSEVPDVPWQLTSTPIAHGEQVVGTLSGDGRLLGTVVQVDRLHLAQDPGTADASGRYDYESGSYTAAVRGAGLQLGRPFVPETLGTLVVDAQFEGSGTLDAPEESGFVRVVPQGSRIANLVGASETRLQLADGRVQTRTFISKLGAFIDASVAPTAPYDVRGTTVVNRLDVEPLALAAGAVEGTVRARSASARRSRVS